MLDVHLAYLNLIATYIIDRLSVSIIPKTASFVALSSSIEDTNKCAFISKVKRVNKKIN